MDNILIGIDIGGTKTALIKGDKYCNIFDRIEFKTESRLGPESFFERLTSNISRFQNSKPAGIGISVGGPLDTSKGIIYNPRHLPWGEVNLRAFFEEKYDCSVKVEHDAKAGALAELKLGAGKGYKNIVFLTLGTGLGAGIIINGEIYRGSKGFSGEVGHIKLTEEFPFRYGRYCGGDGIAKLANNMYPEVFDSAVSCKDVSAAARNGSAEAMKVLEKSGKYMGRGLSILMDILDPDRIILGALSWRLPESWLETALKVVDKESLAGVSARERIVSSGLKERIGDYAALVTATRSIEEGSVIVH